MWSRSLDDQPIETTLYSLTDATPGPPQRRGDERFLSLLRVGTLLVEGRRELCLIRNISAGGMMVRVYSPVSPGTALAIELKEGEPVSGKAQWAEDGLIGIHFDKRIDILTLIAPGEDSPPPRMPRIEIDRTAWVREGANVRRTKAVNISQGGICIDSSADLAVNANVTVNLPGLSPIPGVVRWRDGNCYGVAFNRVLPLSDLVGWLQGQQGQDRQRAAS
jgi:PilZ domain